MAQIDKTLKSRSDVSIVLVFFIALTVFGVAAAGYAVNDYARARASAAWPVYEGVTLSPRGRGDDMRYVYSVDGRMYEGARLKFFSGFFSHDGAALKAGPGETVRVYVDPENHRFAVLAPGGSGAVFVIASVLAGSCVFLGVGGVVRTLTVAGAGAARDEAVSAWCG